MNVIGIESSCDDTAIAIVNSNREIIANVVISQYTEHLPYSGVVPEIAARAHLKNLQYAMKETLNQAKINFTDIDVIAATSGPGLIGGDNSRLSIWAGNCMRLRQRFHCGKPFRRAYTSGAAKREH